MVPGESAGLQVIIGFARTQTTVMKTRSILQYIGAPERYHITFDLGTYIPRMSDINSG